VALKVLEEINTFILNLKLKIQQSQVILNMLVRNLNDPEKEKEFLRNALEM
jgi:uncharacterized coiled-coil protein SlyX